MDEHIHKALREPFPPSAIGKLPKGGTTLDYVGHAAVTDRLLEVDPEWNWEPVAWTAEGLPLYRIEGNEAVLWIRLTIGGVTRLGVGICSSKAFELEKQLISDALRNAAMRFGVALDLWSKEDLHGDSGSSSSSTSSTSSDELRRRAGGPKPEGQRPNGITNDDFSFIMDNAKVLNEESTAAVKAMRDALGIHRIGDADEDQGKALRAYMERVIQAQVESQPVPAAPEPEPEPEPA